MSLAEQPKAKSPSTLIAHVLGGLLQQRLRRQHVLHLGGADAEGERAHGAVRGGVAVAADDGHAGQRAAQLRPDDVDDALPVVEQRDVGHAELGDVALQGLDLEAALGVADAGAARLVRGDVVVHHGERRVRPAHLAPGGAQALEGLRRRHLVGEVEVDVEERRAVRERVHHVGGPDLVEERARRLR
jgi:hypothetical protein